MSQTVWNWIFTGLLVAQSLEIIHLLKEQTLMKMVISGLCAMDEVKVKETENGIALVRGDDEDSEDDDQ